MGNVNLILLGLGNFGLPIGKNLIESGYNVHSTTVDGHGKAGIEKLVEFGGKFIEEKDFSKAEALILCLPRPSDVQSIINKFREKLPPIIIDLSTGNPVISKKIGESLGKGGITYIDSPVSGSTDDARNGRLTLFVGSKEDTNPLTRDLLNTIGANIFFFHKYGDGQKAKLLNQLIHLSNIGIIGEALNLAKKVDLDPKTLVSALKTASAGSKMLDRFGDSIVDNDFSPHFTLELASKDLGLLNSFAGDAQYQLTYGELTTKNYYEKLAEGKGKYNFTIVCE